MDRLRVTDGASQEDRYPAALGDDYFRLDERPFEDLVASTAELAKEIAFYNVRNEPSGNWQPLFASDDAVAMAEIVATDYTRMKDEFLPLLEASTADAALHLAGLARRFDRWYQRLATSSSDTGQTLRRMIVDRQMRAGLNDVGAALSRARPEGYAGEHVERISKSRHPRSEQRSLAARLEHPFDPVWRLPCRTLAEYSLRSRREDDVEAAQRDRSALRAAFYTFLHSLAAMKPVAARGLEESLGSGNHDPAMAVFLTFAKLFMKAREQANRFTGLHRDFYYHDALRMKPKPRSPDSTFLVFDAEPSATPLTAPAGTAFLGGKDADGAEIRFRTREDLTVTDVHARSLRTVECRRDPLVSPERDLGFVCAIRSAEVRNAPGKTPTPLFGELSGAQSADIGFAVACPTLLLTEGRRVITVTLRFPVPPADGKSPGTLMRRVILERATAAERQAFDKFAAPFRAGNPNSLLAQDPAEIFQRVFGTAFRIDITTAAGWQAVSGCVVSPASKGSPDQLCDLAFTIELWPDVPAAAVWNPAIHGGGFDATFPVLRFLLNPHAEAYPYSLLQDLRIEEAVVDCTVSDATNIVAWNQQGRLDTSKPFLPFGPLPDGNSWLILGNYESARMRLEDLRFDIEWGNLPSDFPGYYRGYENPYEDGVFVAALSVLRDGRWRPDPPQAATAPLFRPAQSFTPLLDKYFRPLGASVAEEEFLYDQKARNGFFRIGIAAPPYGFGHAEYPQRLTEVLSQNALASKWIKRAPAPLPNPPYTPVINRVTATYSGRSEFGGASSATGASAERFYCIHPFGVEAVDSSKPWGLLPVLEAEGNLYLGLSSARPSGLLTLLFQLREDASTRISDTQTATWHYLSPGGWRPFDEHQVLSDTTEGFLCSGIVTLDLPEDLSADSGLMPKGLYWLRLSALEVRDSFSGIYAVSAQAAVAERTWTGATSSAAPRLPANSIVGPAISIPGVRKVAQPLASFGGQDAENARSLLARTAGRLRHRFRASTPWDYERLVLENFPDVFKVKCFPALAATVDEEAAPRPGAVMVVVVPYPRQGDAFETMGPTLNAIRLKRIRDFLRPLTSPFAQLEVRNPLYEQVIVSCRIGLTKEADGRRGKQLALLNQAIVDYLSPWSAIGPKPRFGWAFANSEVETYLRRLPYVQSVSDFSLLKVTDVSRVDGWRLEDTARRAESGVSWSRPWSLAIPAPKHNFDVTPIVPVAPAADDPRRKLTGIGRMEIGRTFIISQ